MEVNLLDRMLAAYLEKQTPVTMVLQNKTRLSGKIRAYDSYIIILEGPKGDIVYRHSISSVTPIVRAEVQHQPAPRSAQKSTASGMARNAPARVAPQKARPSQKPAAAASNDSSINNGMKDGLLKWMQEQKEAKRA